ncbi:MAG: hypothetical protein KGZ39_05565 [Simkania sp.]|nr:hypothetical protein [Simkania sp.]
MSQKVVTIPSGTVAEDMPRFILPIKVQGITSPVISITDGADVIVPYEVLDLGGEQLHAYAKIDVSASLDTVVKVNY